MAEYHTVCKVSDLVEGQGQVVQVGSKLIALFRVNDQFYAIDDVCPHMGASLSEGCVENDIVTCSWHGWRFRLSDGTWADSPKIKIGSYPVRIEGDEIQIAVATPATKPT